MPLPRCKQNSTENPTLKFWRGPPMIGPHDLIVAATALSRRWVVATLKSAISLISLSL
jgi:hypothetical protein